MIQDTKRFKSAALRVLRLGILWPLLLLLASFVIFFEFIADIGGSAAPAPAPTATPTPVASAAPTSGPFSATDDGTTVITSASQERVIYIGYLTGLSDPEPTSGAVRFRSR
ncbi:MAG: hypothetical protein V3S00_00625 [Dehalococcoidia bacterium]